MDGSSKTNTASVCVRPVSLASLRRCASPPERLGVSSPSVRYPSPSERSVSSRWRTVFIPRQKAAASVTSMSISPGREADCPSAFVSRISCAARGSRGREPSRPGETARQDSPRPSRRNRGSAESRCYTRSRPPSGCAPSLRGSGRRACAARRGRSRRLRQSSGRSARWASRR